MKTVYLTPRGAFRNELHSDTLFGLICWGIRQVYSEAVLEELLAAFASGEPPFVLSSAFPYRQEEGEAKHYLPRPLLEAESVRQDRQERSPKAQRQEADQRKRFKKVHWLPAEHFNEMLLGRLSPDTYYRSQVWQDVKAPAIEPFDRLQNRIDRLSGRTDGDGTLYSLPAYQVHGGGLYFLVDGEGVDRVEGALRFLADFGLGGRNSTGLGQFSVQVEERTVLACPDEADRFVTLSLYHPTKKEAAQWAQAGCAYELMLRKGKIGGHFLRLGDFWKRSVMMFAPGSTFPLLPRQTTYGCNPIVKSRNAELPFDVQQMGYAFIARMKTARE